MSVIETMTFRLAADVARGEVESIDARYQQEVAYQQPGLLRRTVAVAADGSWIVVTVWADEASAMSSRGLDDTELGRELLARIVDRSINRYVALG